MADFEQLPIALTTIRDGALLEMERLRNAVESLTVAEWQVPSAASGWTIGEVVAHLDLFLGIYHRLLARLLAGDRLARLATTVDRLALSALPSATPIFNTVNGAIPKALARSVSAEALQTRFVKSAARTGDVLLRLAPIDAAASANVTDGTNRLSFYVAIVVNELAIHGWDIASGREVRPETCRGGRGGVPPERRLSSPTVATGDRLRAANGFPAQRLGEVAGLSESARLILPWFYWSATPLMLHLPRRLGGTVQVLLSEPEAAMWWSITGGSVAAGRDRATEPDVTIRLSSERYVLALAGRLRPAEALDSSTAVEGDGLLAANFLAAWRLI
ncbi:MAG TPA: maleylpyruvate isomerase N-terminal domain-containing protein [Chloroflexota bacterium]|nr:maleylpyruvate isomerase N-terminal domain-containing protein [Chloroflexota bacterium]